MNPEQYKHKIEGNIQYKKLNIFDQFLTCEELSALKAQDVKKFLTKFVQFTIPSLLPHCLLHNQFHMSVHITLTKHKNNTESEATFNNT
jgi:hypothetical protein